jgi:hypothetical protein
MATQDSVVSWYRAGQVCIRAGRRDQALVLVGEILRQDPLHPLALSLLREMEDAALELDAHSEHWCPV